MFINRMFVTLLAGFAMMSPVFANDQDASAAPSSEAVQSEAAKMEDGKAPEMSATSDAAAQPAADASAAHAEMTKVNVNKASAKELSKVKGVSMYRARQLVAYRKKHGDFKSLDMLKEVKGFMKLSDDKLKEIQDQLSVE